MTEQKIPPHVVRNSKVDSPRKWKSLKRKQARAAHKAIDELSMGCAYFPSDSYDVEDAAKAIEKVIADLSVKNWGQ